MPVFKHAAGRQPKRKLRIWTLGCRFIRQCKDARLAIGKTVELNARPSLDIWVMPFTEAPARFLAVDNGPAQAAYLVVGLKRGQVMPMPASKTGVFLKQALLHIETERLSFIIQVPSLYF